MADVCLLTNVPAPYRLPIFHELGKHHTLKILFCQSETENRRWNASPGGYSFNFSFLNATGRGTLQLPRDMLSLDLRPYDLLIVGENPKNFSTILAGLANAISSDTPIVLWTEGIPVNKFEHSNAFSLARAPLSHLYDWLIRRPMYKIPEGFIAASGDMTREYLENRSVNSEKIITGTQIIPECLLGERSKKSDNSDDETIRILTLTYLRRAKGIDVLIEAFHSLDVQNAKLIIAGSGPDESRLRRLASKDISFVGHVTGAQKWSLYRDADIFVLPTFIDTWGMVVNEAMYFGTPIVTTNVAGSSQLVEDNEAGIVIPPGDHKILANTLRNLIQDPNRRHELSVNAENATMAWDIDIGVEPFLTAIERFGSETHRS